MNNAPAPPPLDTEQEILRRLLNGSPMTGDLESLYRSYTLSVGRAIIGGDSSPELIAKYEQEFASALTTLADATRILSPLGWAPSCLLSIEAAAQALAVRRSGGTDDDVDTAMTIALRSSKWPPLLGPRLWNHAGSVHPPLTASIRQRSGLVKEAWANHVDGRYASAATLVLTQVEGIVMDATGGRPFFSRRGTKAAVRDESTIAGLPAALPSLRDLFTEPVNVTAADGSLSRHGVLHGRELGFGTEVYSAKVFCLLACVMEWSRSLFVQVSHSLQLELEMTHAGLLGTTSEGVKLDDREFAATKAALKKTREDIARQYGRVHSVEATKTLIANLAMFGLDNVDPASCFVTVSSKDEWYAWRVTPGNWCLGICDQRDTTDSVWDAETPPSNGASVLGSGWIDLVDEPPNWD